MPATDILGKIGEKVGTEFNSFRVSIGNTYATQAALNSLSATVSSNSTDIATNTTDIAANTSSIATNATGISTNATAIATNTTDIAANASNIATNTSNISTNASSISNLNLKTSSIATDGNSAAFSGDLSAKDLTLSGNLKVNGTQTFLNTQTLEVEDNIIEVNLVPTTGAETAQTGGLQVNRGKDNTGNFLDKASFIWDDANDLFSLKKGTSDAKLNVGDVDAEKVILPNGSAILINNVSLGNYASFETEFLANL